MAEYVLEHTEKLQGAENFETWQFAMKMKLVELDLWITVDDENFDLTNIGNKRKNEKALAKICLSLKPELYMMVKPCQTAREAWVKLSNTFEQRGLQRKIHLRKELQNLTYGSCKNMQDFLNKVTTIQQQLGMMGANIPEDELTLMILMKLPETYHALVVTLEGLEADKLTMDLITNRLLQEEARQMFMDDTINPENALHMKSKQKQHNKYEEVRNTPNRWTPRKVTPKKWSQDEKPKQFGTMRSAEKDKGRLCFHCGKPGHMAKYCWHKGNGTPRKSWNNSNNELLLTNTEGVESAKSIREDKWFIDSGATTHMTFQENYLCADRKSIDRSLIMADGNTAKSTLQGTVKLNVKVSNGSKSVRLEDVIYSSELNANLISVPKITNSGHKVVFTNKKCFITKQNGELIATGSREGNLYVLDTATEQTYSVLDQEKENILWHKRLGHINNTDMSLLRDKQGRGLPQTVSSVHDCKECVYGKHHRTVFPKSEGGRATEILEIVHSDICGPIEIPSLGGNRYFISFTDDKSRFSKIYMMKHKSEALMKFKEFKAEAERQTGQRIKTLRTDNGTEYTNITFQTYLKCCGIIHERTVPMNPEQNGVAERLNRTLLEKARCMLIDAGLPKIFWAEAVNTANYIKNRSPTAALKDKTPYEIWRGRVPCLSHLRVFGCTAMIHVPKQKRLKLDPKARECIFIGYSETCKGYKMLDKETRKVVMSRDVVFYEHQTHPKPKDESPIKFGIDSETEEPDQIQENVEEMPQENVEEIPQEIIVNQDIDQNENIIQPENVEQNEQVVQQRHTTRQHKRNKKFYGDDYINFTTLDEPQSYKEAVSCTEARHWKDAIDREIKSLEENETWILTELPPGRAPIKCKWTFKRKYDKDGNISTYKARLVAKGYSQVEGIDFNETFAPVAKLNTLRTIIASAAEHDLLLHQVDVETAYLNGILEEEIYMKQPEGYSIDDSKCCKLKKSLYGLKQSGRVWNQLLHEKMEKFDMIQSHSDPCLYTKRSGSNILIICVYVDDILIAANEGEEIKKFKTYLASNFKIKDLGELHYLLGIKVSRNKEKNEIQLDQTNFIKQMLQKFNMQNCKPVGTPVEVGANFTENNDQEETQQLQGVPYLSAVGSIMYVAMGTRPDIAYIISKLCQHSSNPQAVHWKAIKRLLRYLKGTMNLKLTYRKTDMKYVEVFCDSDWAGDHETRKSTTGYMLFLGGAAIGWSSKKQQTVALSSTEAEYMALTQATKEAIWILRLVNELPLEITQESIEVHCDNQSAIKLSRNSICHNRTKHIDIQHHFVREKVDSGQIKIKYKPTEEMIADMLTKGLPREKHMKFLALSGLC